MATSYAGVVWSTHSSLAAVTSASSVYDDIQMALVPLVSS